MLIPSISKTTGDLWEGGQRSEGLPRGSLLEPVQSLMGFPTGSQVFSDLTTMWRWKTLRLPWGHPSRWLPALQPQPSRVLSCDSTSKEWRLHQMEQG